MNILLQHWHGEVTDVELQSWESMARYAASVGAEHRVLRGEPIAGVTNPQMHKLHMLSEEFDGYDLLVMVDSDMFARESAENVFEATGVGVCGDLQRTLRDSCRRRVPHRFRKARAADYYGGAVYRLTREQRISLRLHLNAGVMRDFDEYNRGCDEGVMHYLATREGFVGRGLSGGDLWACSSYSRDAGLAHFVHVRRRMREGSEQRRDKTVALRELREAGVLA